MVSINKLNKKNKVKFSILENQKKACNDKVCNSFDFDLEVEKKSDYEGCRWDCEG